MTDKERIEQLESIINNAKNEMEALKKNDDWKPKGEYYFGDEFIIEHSANYGKNNNNRFDTEEEAEKIAKKVNVWLKLYHIAKYLNDGWEPDLEDGDECKYYLYLHNYEGVYKIKITHTIYTSNGAVIYFKTEEKAEEAIKLMGDDIKLLFD